MKAYHFKHWNELYENNSSRTVQMLTYYCQPNKLVGEGLGFMLMQPDGLELYGTLGFLKSLASMSERHYRGWLVRGGTPLDAARISALTRIPADKIQRALEFFSTGPMDWLPQEEMPDGKASASRQPTDGKASASRQPTDGKASASRQPTDGNFAGLMTDQMRTDKGKKKKRKEFRTGEGEASAQSKQFASADARRKQLDAVSEDELEPGQLRELKKMRALVALIQKKQRAGDFSPVDENDL